MIHMEQYNPKSITWLQSQGWYRFLKVVYLLALLLVLVALNIFVLSGESQSLGPIFVYVNIITLAIFELIRRIFYYIVLGKVVPEK